MKECKPFKEKRTPMGVIVILFGDSVGVMTANAGYTYSYVAA